MIVRIANHTFELNLTYETELQKRYIDYIASNVDNIDTTIISIFSDSLIPFDDTFDVSSNEAQMRQTGGGMTIIARYRSGELVHQMRFDDAFQQIEIHSLVARNMETSVELEHIKCGLGFALSLLHNQGLVLHGSCISYLNQGIIFSADSGVGKSTQSNLWMSYFKGEVIMINDDKPAIMVSENDVYAYGTPFSGKHNLQTNDRVKLHGIVFLRRSLTNHIRTLKVADVIPLLLNQLTRFDYDLSKMDLCLEVVNQILTIVPCYELSCNMELEAVKVAHQALFGGNL